MLNKLTMKRCAVWVALAALLSSSAMAANATVLVVPSRYTVIQLAFDVEALRDITLLAYDKNLDTDETVLHVWESDKLAWGRLTLDQYAMGSFTSGTPDEMILVGSDADLPSIVLAGASEAKKVTRIKTLNLVTVVNTLNRSLSFKPDEWEILSERHGLEIKDFNYERRRWGRYGPPKKNKSDENQPANEDQDSVELLEDELDAEMIIPIEEKGLDLAPETAPIEDVVPEAETPLEAEAAPVAEAEAAVEEVQTLTVDKAEVEIPVEEKGLDLAPETAPIEDVVPEAETPLEAEAAPVAEAEAAVEEVQTLTVDKAEVEIPVEEKGLDLAPETAPIEDVAPEAETPLEAEAAPVAETEVAVEEVQTLVVDEMDAADK